MNIGIILIDAIIYNTSVLATNEWDLPKMEATETGQFGKVFGYIIILHLEENVIINK